MGVGMHMVVLTNHALLHNIFSTFTSLLSSETTVLSIHQDAEQGVAAFVTTLVFYNLSRLLVTENFAWWEEGSYIGAHGLNRAADQALTASVLHSGLILLGVGVVLPVLLNCRKTKAVSAIMHSTEIKDSDNTRRHPGKMQTTAGVFSFSDREKHAMIFDKHLQM